MEGYKIYTVRHYLEERPIKSFVILRHDVDRFPRNALRMAMVEAEKGVSSTYYFRVGHDLNLGIIRDQVRAKGLFRKELELLRSACEIKTISRHGQPLSRFDNGTLWNGSSFKPYGVLGDAGLSIIGVPYYTDAGRSWDGRNSLRDRPREPCGVIVRDTFELIEMLRSRFHEGVYLNIHPERWVRNVPEWCVSYSIDLCFNIGKRVVNSTRD
jgi:hypothetical protein